ncbi:uncharacterized protein LTR77_001484 [Saxophila tyrrhenica]|uniref:Borealin N-terminal domain-containing protein n=1 Tax=Saxophila tyrrhenica TaxID=1690608 RepID=A0AAV9PLM5_9PEZI|nr:hypothetical protein LTR77_001484 [Saxophila tyrrhenica]
MPPRKAPQHPASAEPTVVLQPPTNQNAQTPPQSPSKGAAGITQAQKQALIDNLQLEITERARKLRAQYAQQSQALRSRLEMRINRIPPGLRKRKMQDLLDEHAEKANPKPAPAVPVQEEQQQKEGTPARKSLKRQSEEMAAEENDKENVPASSQATQADLANPKKRAKTTTTTTAANTKASRTASRKVAPSSVLSPKSHNSRTLPRSPIKPANSFEKPSSPVKPTTTTAPAAGKRTASRAQAKRGAPAPPANEGDTSRSSEASNTSAGTTIVTKAPPAKGRAAAGAKKAPADPKTTTATAKRGAAAKKENVPPVPTAAAGRSLRKRG